MPISSSSLFLSSFHLDCVVLLNLLCVICVDPALMRKSTSVDSSVGKPGRLTVCTNQAWCHVNKNHVSHCLLVKLCCIQCRFSAGNTVSFSRALPEVCELCELNVKMKIDLCLQFTLTCLLSLLMSTTTH